MFVLLSAQTLRRGRPSPAHTPSVVFFAAALVFWSLLDVAKLSRWTCSLLPGRLGKNCQRAFSPHTVSLFTESRFSARGKIFNRCSRSEYFLQDCDIFCMKSSFYAQLPRNFCTGCWGRVYTSIKSRRLTDNPASETGREQFSSCMTINPVDLSSPVSSDSSFSRIIPALNKALGATALYINEPISVEAMSNADSRF